MDNDTQNPDDLTVFNWLSHAFTGEALVNSEVLLTTMFYLEKWFWKTASGADAELLALLEKEHIDEDTADYLRQCLVRFASTTSSLPLLAQSIDVLRVFRDPRLIPLFDAWLMRHVQQATEHFRIVHSLMLTLQDSGEAVTDRHSISAVDYYDTVRDCKMYLRRKLGVDLPG